MTADPTAEAGAGKLRTKRRNGRRINEDSEKEPKILEDVRCRLGVIVYKPGGCR